MICGGTERAFFAAWNSKVFSRVTGGTSVQNVETTGIWTHFAFAFCCLRCAERSRIWTSVQGARQAGSAAVLPGLHGGLVYQRYRVQRGPHAGAGATVHQCGRPGATVPGTGPIRSPFGVTRNNRTKYLYVPGVRLSRDQQWTYGPEGWTLNIRMRKSKSVPQKRECQGGRN